MNQTDRINGLDYKLFKGDCLEVLDDLTSKVHFVLTDLPYGVTKNKWDEPLCLNKMWEKLGNIVYPQSVFAFTAIQPFTSKLVCSNLPWFRYEWIWEKSKASGFLNAKRRPLNAHENVLVFSQNPHDYYPVMTCGTPYDKGKRKQQDQTDSYGNYKQRVVKSEGARYPRSVQYHKTAEREGGFHKTQKPLELMKYFIKTYTKEGDTVLDICMGSGTTGVAAINTGRKFIGIELNGAYFDIAQKRIQEQADAILEGEG